MKLAGWMAAVREDAAFAVRSLARVPVYTATVLATLALAVGGVSAVFSVLYAVVLKPLPYPDADRLVSVHANFPASKLENIVISPRELLDLRERAKSFQGVAGFATGSVNVTGHGEAQRIEAGYVTADYFRVMGTPPALGRAFVQGEDALTAPPVALIGPRFHARFFGGDPNVVGKTIQLDGVTTTIIGVLPPVYERSIRGMAEVGLNTGERLDIWAPLSFTAEQIDPRARGGRFVTAVARLAPGVTIEQAASEVHALGVRFAEEHPTSYTPESGFHLSLRTLHALSAGKAAAVLNLLLAAVLLLLLAACANVVSLALARLATRRREIAVRAAVGATDGRIVLQFLVESVLLAVTGGALGVAVGRIGMDALLVANASRLVRNVEVGFHLPVLAFAFAVCVVTGLVVGIVPAIHASRLQPVDGMREGGRSTGRSAARLRSALVVAQVAVALVLLVSAGTLLQKLVSLTRTSPGFDARNVYTARMTLSYQDAAKQRRMASAVAERVAAIPGVEAAGVTSSLPLLGWSDWSYEVEGVERPAGSVRPNAQVRSIGGDYFKALGITIREGRAFGGGDDDKAPHVVIVNQEAVRRSFAGLDPIGRHVTLTMTPLSPPESFTVVGVVDDTRDMGLDAPVQPFLFMPFAQVARDSVDVVARAPALGTAVFPAIRAAVTEIDPTQALYALEPLSEIVDESLGPHRFTLTLFAIFAALALTLAALGIYGITSYSVAQRTQELAVRMAMGADDGIILRLVLWQAVRLLGLGLLLGGAIAVATGHVLASFMFGLSPSDPTALLTIGGVLLLTGVVAGAVPAHRATSLELANALRTE